MTTISTVQSETETRTASATDVRNLATAISEEILMLHEFYRRHFPYDKGKLIKDIGLLLLFDMTAKIVIEFYEMVNGQKVEKLSYTYLPQSDPGAVNSLPGDFPRFEISPDWQVRVVSYYSKTKPESEVREFYNQLGWRPVDLLTRTGQGATERYGEFRSGDVTIIKEVYKDLQDKHHTDHKELPLHEIN